MEFRLREHIGMEDGSSLDLDKYCQLMEEVKRRTAVVKHFLDGPQHALYEATAIESACLQIRKILELVVLGSLVANQSAWDGSLRELRNAWNANDILRRLRRINPDFYPQPVNELPQTGPIKSTIVNREDDFLAEDMFADVYGRLGGIIHANNPIGGPVDYEYWKAEVPKWMRLIINLLNSHQVRVLDNPNMFLIHMNDESNGNVTGYVFELLGSGTIPGEKPT